MSKDFRAELITFLKDVKDRPYEEYGYINPFLLNGIVDSLYGTVPESEPVLDELSQWVSSMFGQ